MGLGWLTVTGIEVVESEETDQMIATPLGASAAGAVYNRVYPFSIDRNTSRTVMDDLRIIIIDTVIRN